jgi:transcriptional regulator of arginine metabolism
MSIKARRQARLLEIIRSSRIGTQEELVAELNERGFECTQASVSRDIRELGLVKQGGRYAEAEAASAPAPEELAPQIGGFLRQAIPVGENLLVIHTISGTANSVAVYIDSRGWPGLVGTVAGDDTIIAVVESRQAGEQLARFLARVQEESR